MIAYTKQCPHIACEGSSESSKMDDILQNFMKRIILVESLLQRVTAFGQEASASRANP
jgi:hypothetical protein